jgi:hypothetical protein
MKPLRGHFIQKPYVEKDYKTDKIILKNIVISDLTIVFQENIVFRESHKVNC